jgi:hypothetical protein
VSAGVEGVVVDRDRAFCSELVHDGLSADAAEVLNLLERDPWSPPELPLSRRGALRELEKAGLAAEVGSLWFAVSAVDRAATVLAGLLSEDPSGFTVSAARNALGSSRKYLVPLLEHLDSKGVTRRIGDARVAGPRMVVSTEAR